MVELLTSGVLTVKKEAAIDAFLVGGGSSGRSGSRATSGAIAGGIGGSGGTTKTLLNIIPRVNTEYPIVIGAGGAATYTPDNGGLSANPGGDTVAFGSTAAGGTVTSGGSGGGAGARVAKAANGGSDGADGGSSSSGSSSDKGGTGQGTTTREFGEATGKLYAGGGGGGRYISAQSPVVSAGGSGGGGTGGWCGTANTQAAAAGVANTGGGGGGGAIGPDTRVTVPGASGGSGIVCFRDAQELPELAGTWVLNNRLYAPENDVYFNNQQFKSGDASNPNRGTGINLSCTTSKIWYTSYPSGYDVTVYTFSTNSWGSDKLNYITFSAGATASDEFRAWLASNATKQA